MADPEALQERLQPDYRHDMLDTAHTLRADLINFPPRSLTISNAIDLMGEAVTQIQGLTFFDRPELRGDDEPELDYTHRVLQEDIAVSQYEAVGFILGRALLAIRDKEIAGDHDPSLQVRVVTNSHPRDHQASVQYAVAFSHTDIMGGRHTVEVPLRDLLLTGELSREEEIRTAIAEGGVTGIQNVHVNEPPVQPTRLPRAPRPSSALRRTALAAPEAHAEPTEDDLRRDIVALLEVATEANRLGQPNYEANAQIIKLTEQLIRLIGPSRINAYDILQSQGARPPGPLEIRGRHRHDPPLRIDVWAACVGQDTRTENRTTRFRDFMVQLRKIVPSGSY